MAPRIAFPSLAPTVQVSIGAGHDLENDYSYDKLNRLTRVDQIGQSGGNAVANKRVDFAYKADGQLDTIKRYANLARTHDRW